MTNFLDKVLSKRKNWEKVFSRLKLDISSQIADYIENDPDLNQKVLADKLGKKESEISKWLTGNHNFTIKSIAKIEAAIGKDLVVVPKFANLHNSIKVSEKVTYVYLAQDSDNLSISDMQMSYGLTEPIFSLTNNKC